MDSSKIKIFRIEGLQEALDNKQPKGEYPTQKDFDNLVVNVQNQIDDKPRLGYNNTFEGYNTFNSKVNLDGDTTANGNTIINGSLTANGKSTFNNEVNMPVEHSLKAKTPILLKQGGNEGGQIDFEKATNSTLKSNPYIDTWQNQIRVVCGSNASSKTIIPFAVDLNTGTCTTDTDVPSSASGNEFVTAKWVNAKNTAIDATCVHKTGNETIDGVKTFKQTIQGTSLRAQWGDLAEYYESDNNYPKGTLVKFGGDKEITIADNMANAVITSNPGLILNNSMSNGQAIALVGRVPVRVIGKVNKFDNLELSNIPGVAQKQSQGKIIAKALENKINDEENLILCVVKLEF